MAVYVAIVSALRGQPIEVGSVVSGEMSVQGNLEGMDSVGEDPEVPRDRRRTGVRLDRFDVPKKMLNVNMGDSLLPGRVCGFLKQMHRKVPGLAWEGSAGGETSPAACVVNNSAFGLTEDSAPRSLKSAQRFLEKVERIRS
jgi:hypothetical protein